MREMELLYEPRPFREKRDDSEWRNVAAFREETSKKR
jgi:hypothetical protein